MASRAVGVVAKLPRRCCLTITWTHGDVDEFGVKTGQSASRENVFGFDYGNWRILLGHFGNVELNMCLHIMFLAIYVHLPLRATAVQGALPSLRVWPSVATLSRDKQTQTYLGEHSHYPSRCRWNKFRSNTD